MIISLKLNFGIHIILNKITIAKLKIYSVIRTLLHIQIPALASLEVIR